MAGLLPRPRGLQRRRGTAPPLGALGAGGLASLPEELWGHASTWLLPGEFVRLSWCRPRLFVMAEMQGLWHHFCRLVGYVRRGDGVVDIVPLASAQLGGQEPQGSESPLDWHRVFQTNAAAEALGEAAFSWLWVNREEVRLVSARGESRGATDSLQRAWLLEHGWRPPAALRHALRQVLWDSCRAAPFRLREVVAGRPGSRAKRACFFAGDCPAGCAVEWPLGRSADGSWLWPLPPQATEGSMEPEEDEWQDDPAFHPGPHPWDRSSGFLLELLAEQPPELLHTPADVGQATSRSLWVHVGGHQSASSLTVKDLVRELAPHLPQLGLSSCSRAVPANLRRPFQASEDIQPQWLLVKDLRWTQAERLYVYEAPPRAAGRGPAGGQDGGLALFLRDSARLPRGAAGRGRGWQGEEPPAPYGAGAGGGFGGGSLDSCGLGAAEGQGGAGTGASGASSSGGRRPRSGRSQPAPLAAMVGGGGGGAARGSEVPLTGLVPHERKLLLASGGVRQFEFHPARPGCMLVGRKDGTVLVLDHEADTQTHSLEVDTHPILGLSWLQTQPQWAVVGASQSGGISMLRYDECRPGSLEQLQLEPFSHLSSLSVNCTDDYFMTSGFCVDLGLYDIVTGRRLSTFRGMHQNFINILRFAHRSPHLFATASFDHTCKVWDLRGPVRAERPARLFGTETLNVMCCFSPDDRHLLCSGVDEALQQFELQARAGGSHFPLPSLGSDTNYRRSLYLADGSLVGTAATNESLVRLYTAEAPHRHLGCIDFRSMLRQRRQSAQCGPSPAEDPSEAAPEEEHGKEYVQSLRCHPKDPTKLAALLSTCDQHPESYISLVHLGKERAGEPLG